MKWLQRLFQKPSIPKVEISSGPDPNQIDIYLPGPYAALVDRLARENDLSPEEFTFNLLKEELPLHEMVHVGMYPLWDHLDHIDRIIVALLCSGYALKSIAPLIHFSYSGTRRRAFAIRSRLGLRRASDIRHQFRGVDFNPWVSRFLKDRRGK